MEVRKKSSMKPKGQEKEKPKGMDGGAVQQKQQASMNDFSFSLRGVTCPQSLYHFEAKPSGFTYPTVLRFPAGPDDIFPVSSQQNSGHHPPQAKRHCLAWHSIPEEAAPLFVHLAPGQLPRRIWDE
jgi:hypothetical protein